MIGRLIASATTAVLWRVVCVLVLLLVLGIGGQQLRVLSARADAAESRRELAESRQALLAATATAERKARAAEQRQRDALAGIQATYKTEMSHAQDVQAAVAAGLRADNLRLRGHWQGCLATADLSAAAAGAAGTDGSAELRAASAGRVIAAGAECDAQVRGLQSVIRAYTDDEG